MPLWGSAIGSKSSLIYLLGGQNTQYGNNYIYDIYQFDGTLFTSLENHTLPHSVHSLPFSVNVEDIIFFIAFGAFTDKHYYLMGYNITSFNLQYNVSTYIFKGVFLCVHIHIFSEFFCVCILKAFSNYFVCFCCEIFLAENLLQQKASKIIEKR